MKNYSDILEEIKQTSAVIKALETQERDLTESYMKNCDLKKLIKFHRLSARRLC